MSHSRTRRPWWVAFAASAAALMLSGWWIAVSPETGGTVSPLLPVETAAPSPSASPAPISAAPVQAMPAELPTPRVDRGTPTRLTIAALGVDAPVDAVGVTSDGMMEIPASGLRVGWYRYGAAPGDGTGHAVFASHVNTRAEGQGVLARIGELAVGDEVVVATGAGDVRYAVSARRIVPKSGLDTRGVFARTGEPRLLLVTCGGPWLAEADSYRDNVVVEAVPVRGR